jgi:nucleotide-binding universal stress UspA family protein
MGLRDALRSRDGGAGAGVRRILVATDRSETAEHAVRFAAEMAVCFEAELVLCQVVVPPAQAPPRAKEELVEYGRGFVGDLARAVIASGEDPGQAIVDAAEAEDVDVVVVGNVGMSGRKEFLLGNVPNRVSHNSRRTVVIVNTLQRIEQQQRKGLFGR